MKYRHHLYTILIVLLCVTTISCKEKATLEGRTTYNLKDWSYRYDEQKGADSLYFDDQSWQHVTVPHDWSIYQTYSESNRAKWNNGGLKSGIAWYRRHLSFNSDWENKNIDLVFEGISGSLKVWVNGTLVAKHEQSHTPLHYNITPYLNHNTPNAIAVRIDNNRYKADGVFDGAGITSPVYLSIYSKQHLMPFKYQVYTTEVSEESANIHLKYTLCNEDSTHDAQLIVKHTLIDTSGAVVATCENQVTLAKGETRELSASTTLKNPRLWSPSQPETYYMQSEVYKNNKSIDAYRILTGVCSVAFTDRHVFLNGEEFNVKGVQMHSTAGSLGAYSPEEYTRYRLQLLKQMGCNAIMALDYPFTEDFYNQCDSMGFLVFSELQNRNAYSQEFDSLYNISGFQDVQNKVEYHINHPCIVGWLVDSLAQQAATHTDSSRIVSTTFKNAKCTSFPQAFDYLTSNHFPIRCDTTGLIDLCAFPKDTYYAQQAQWSKIPMIHASPHWTYNPDSVQSVLITTYSNALSVQLLINGHSFGAKANPSKSITWSLPYQNGKLDAVGIGEGGSVVSKVSYTTAQREAQVHLSVVHQPEDIKQGIILIQVEVVDKYNTPLPEAQNLVTLSVTGSAHIIAFDNGNPHDLSSYIDRRKTLYHGKALAVLQIDESTTAVPIHVTALSDGIIEAHLLIK